ncbi:hypothetical protein ACFVXG_04655 [Kitasatospora sp. NPDC058162]|uniref:hypothetical protein n=1 Tax=Kitasatospora sp. NPDC058162 TaxID=3346362 RepID=UPI0036DC0393
MILVPAAVPRTAPAFQRLIDPGRQPSVRAALTVETLPPGVRVEQLSRESVESVTVVLAGRLSAAGRILAPGEVLHHPPGSSHRLTAVRGAPTAVLTVRAVLPAADIPAQRAGSGSVGFTRSAGRIVVDTVVLTPGQDHGPYAETAADAFLVLLSGTGVRLDLAGGGEVPLFPGDLVYLRAGERYGLRAGAGGAPTLVRGRVGAVLGPEQDLEPMQSGQVGPHSGGQSD